jgi:hypothetical protein
MEARKQRRRQGGTRKTMPASIYHHWLPPPTGPRLLMFQAPPSIVPPVWTKSFIHESVGNMSYSNHNTLPLGCKHSWLLQNVKCIQAISESSKSQQFQHFQKYTSSLLWDLRPTLRYEHLQNFKICYILSICNATEWSSHSKIEQWCLRKKNGPKQD